MYSQGYPSQPSYVYVMWLLLTCRQTLVCRMFRKKFGHSFLRRRWAESTGVCSSGENASLQILELCHSLRPEWKQGIKWLTFEFQFNSLLAARTQLLRWLSEWDDTLLLAGSPAAMQVWGKGKRDTVRYLGEPPPTVLPPLWGWRCWPQEPVVSKQCLTPKMVKLRMTGLCHSPGQSIQ